MFQLAGRALARNNNLVSGCVIIPGYLLVQLARVLQSIAFEYVLLW